MIDLNELKLQGEEISVSRIVNTFDEVLDRAITAESKLAELEKQEPCAWTWWGYGDQYFTTDGVKAADIGKEVDMHPLYYDAKPAEAVQDAKPKEGAESLVRFNISAIGDSIVLSESKHGEYCYAHQATTKPQRITEQDAREIAWSASFRTGEKYGQTLYDAINKWWESEGRTLIAKLNENREPEVKASVEPIAYYYTRDRYTPQLREAHRRIPEPDRSLWNEVELVPVTANKAEVPIKQEIDQIINVERLGDQSIKLVFSSCRAASSFYTEALEQLPPLKNEV